MNLRRISITAAILVIGMVSLNALDVESLENVVAAPQLEPAARCTIVVPKQWGEYVGAGSYGLEFKDESGSIRFVKQFPCGVEGPPNVSLEIHRR